MSLTKTKTKTKSLTKNISSFPANGWDYDMEYVLELPRFFENPAWRMIGIEAPPGPEETRKELDQLLAYQKKRLERWWRKPEIEQEADAFSPKQFQRLLLLGPTGAYPSTYMLMEAMVVLGKIVAVHFKDRFMRPRPSQLEPRLRPLLDVPGHPAYPSGHSLQMFLVAKALSTVVRAHEIGVELFAIAQGIAKNREWAGLHYPSDTEAGKKIAFAIFPLVEEAYRESFQKAAREWI